MTANDRNLLAFAGAYTVDGRPPSTDLGTVMLPEKVAYDAARDRLIWSASGYKSARRRDQRPDITTLQKFIGLEDARGERIAAFAQRSGVLSVCKHFLPSSHHEMCGPLVVNRKQKQFWEPVSLWRYFARQAREMVAVADALRHNRADQIKTTSKELSQVSWDKPTLKPRKIAAYEPNESGPLYFEELKPFFEIGAGIGWDRYEKALKQPESRARIADFVSAELRVSLASASRKIDEFARHLPSVVRTILELQRETRQEREQRERTGARNTLGSHVNEWLMWGGVRPRFDWTENGTVIRLSSGGWEQEALFGALAVHLVLAVGGTGGIALCSGCGAPYLPTRRPVDGRRHYCTNCGRKVAERDAARAYRARRRIGPND
jgi:hypothetical protein